MKPTHSQMLTTRRRKNRGKKELAVIAKREKKLRNEEAKAGRAVAPKEGSA